MPPLFFMKEVCEHTSAIHYYKYGLLTITIMVYLFSA